MTSIPEEDAPLDISPIFNRELLTAARKKSPWGNRVFSSGLLLTIILATFGARYYWDQGNVSDHDMMAKVTFQAFLWMLLAQVVMIFGVGAGRAALTIAEEERPGASLDFLLATASLEQAEIVLGKLAACMAFLVAEFAVGLPIMLLLNPLGAIDLRLILLTYAGLLTTGFLTIALAIWVSSSVANARDAAGVSVFWWFAWLMGPFFVSVVFTKVAFRLPELSLDACECMGPGPAASLGLDVQGIGRRRSCAFERAHGSSRLDEWSPSRGRRPFGDLDNRSSALRLSAERQRRYSQSLVARLTRLGLAAASSNHRSATIRSFGGK